jgi:hypothetical protein
MPPRIRVLYAALGLVCLFGAAAPLVRELTRPSNIWWTPQAMLVPLDQGSDRVEIYVRGKPLAALLESGRVRITDAGGSGTLATTDVGLRFNNWDRVRAQRIPVLLIYAAGCAVAALSVALVAMGRLAYHGERETG